ncbi:conserved hypothetical protein [Parvibaculum lavamentivorans DS-1]|uniref:Serine hydrolase domain-containing protein n=1 Tax=Parvibaculum lavamentivorans (strain DS-1 / DSM 13023 / NCIMB 13966) TaxID=402881 RepID=A7HW10_PARL1|nr:dienelactone hydrolase family protein [Parvibaculum lavamentivorans]ABS64093.1 conserved hypothetical protein [Parvibaculum lavamentivorans DS-1]
MTLRPLLLLLFLAGLTATACTTLPDPGERKARADKLAAAQGMEPSTIPAGDFDLYSLIRADRPSGLLIVYLEGDGLAWTRRNEPSPDPTPVSPVALQLAVKDNGPAVAYLARPCQYTQGQARRNCGNETWTNARYSEAVVQSVDAALDKLKERTGAAQLGLVGYSGGGTVAALLAARRHDVAWLKTVASPLDTAAFTRHHQVSGLSGSLNPADDAIRLAAIPQIHYVGEEDDIVPEAINRAFMARLADRRCATLHVMPGLGHRDGWDEAWQGVHSTRPACRK